MNLLITGAWQQAEDFLLEISGYGHSVLFLRQESDPLPCPYEWVEGVVCNGLFLYHPLERFTGLRFIQLTSAGHDRVPMDEIKKRKIEIRNARDVYSIPMAEYAITGVLNLYKGMAGFRQQQAEHTWIKNRQIKELNGRCVVIVGCGSVGTECAKRFKAFGCHVIGVDIVTRENAGYDEIVGLDQLDEKLPGAEIVVLAVPLTEETTRLMDERRLALIGTNTDRYSRPVLVNISRGAVIDQMALVKWDGDAVLDVFEEEPLDSESFLWDRPGTIITPHNSFVGNGNAERLADVVLGNLSVIK